MLETLYITKSRIRRDLLSLFFTNQSKKYYLRELQRILGYSAGSMRRELLRFQEDGLFNTQRVGNLVYYSLNSKHPFFKELKSIVFKIAGVQGSLRKILLSAKKIEAAFIYGSFANKSEKPSSDIDLMIIGNPYISSLNEKIALLEKKLRREINVTIYCSEEYITKKANKSGFITELLRNPKIMLVGEEDDL